MLQARHEWAVNASSGVRISKYLEPGCPATKSQGPPADPPSARKSPADTAHPEYVPHPQARSSAVEAALPGAA